MVKEKQCYKCQKFKPLSDFDDNRMKFQLKSQHGKVFSCFKCEIKDFERLGYRLEYDFENKIFNTVYEPKEIWSKIVK